ncbi:hypothetical protein Hypma_002623 [Hypsizygus marmoreus]|uniref:RING-type E3 ubiquitin transferase n=1 Tax=Hypsizygus marmoreus TaxID=39966 RepID=A0A369J6J9_HYPMA|nr:hypothetical protein Hypma_002623 [Hypsizygus marmoreus]
MSIIDADLHNSSLRRVRSTGDIPRRPDPVHQLRPFRFSDSHSDLGDQHAGPSSLAPLSAPSTSVSGKRSPPLISHLPIPQTQTVGGPSRQMSTSRPVAPPPHSPPPSPPRVSWYRRTMLFLGLGRGASGVRRSLVTLLFDLFSGFSQIVIITVVLSLSGTRFKSPTQPDLTEWAACTRPLGIWACIWVVRAVLACGLTYWGFIRERQLHRRHFEDGHASPTVDPTAIIASGSAASDTQQAILRSDVEAHSLEQPTGPLPYTRLYSRLTLLSSLLTLSWFLTAHILEYSSINTCRHTSPHVWWLTFGILCLMYLMVLEVVLLGFIVFIVAPIIFLFWNIVLICVGRHPLQTHGMIKPEIQKLPKSIVDRIPLVIYIPPPPDGSAQEKLAIPQPVHSYPPKPPALSASEAKSRFRFIRHFSSFKGKKVPSTPQDETSDEKPVENTEEPQTWEEHWEKGEYPFVVLEGNRAACAICLMDFEEPKRIAGAAPQTDSQEEEGGPPVEPIISEDNRAPATNREDTELKLEDAGEGAQPLRLLECGHVFHKTCLDPWLTDISGRCPVCQRAVELPERKKNRKERRLNGNR